MSKKIKKTKRATPTSKPVKKPAAKAVGAVLKKAAKSVVKKVESLAKNKAKASKPAKKVTAAAPPKKVVQKAKAVAKPVKVAKKSEPKAAPKVSSTKEKKVIEKEVAKGKEKKSELLLEVPAPKIRSLLSASKEKKRSGKASSEAAMAANKKRCREPGCEHDFTVGPYCRMHYIKNWRKIKRKEAIIASGQLNNYVEELVSKYPDKYLEVIRQDLASEKDWSKVVADLELDAGEEDLAGDEDLDVATENVQRSRGGEFDDEGDAF